MNRLARSLSPLCKCAPFFWPRHLGRASLVGAGAYSTASAKENTEESPGPEGSPSAPKSESRHGDEMLELQDRYLRALADMENLRHRSRREVEAAHQFSIQRFVRDLLPVADTLEAAFSSIADADKIDASAMKQGLQLTMEELGKMLSTHGVNIIDPLHQKFDPNLHQAILEVESKDFPAGSIVSVHKKGYLLHGRVVRAAVVSVSKEP